MTGSSIEDMQQISDTLSQSADCPWGRMYCLKCKLDQNEILTVMQHIYHTLNDVIIFLYIYHQIDKIHISLTKWAKHRAFSHL